MLAVKPKCLNFDCHVFVIQRGLL